MLKAVFESLVVAILNVVALTTFCIKYVVVVFILPNTVPENLMAAFLRIQLVSVQVNTSVAAVAAVTEVV
jgi:hypothetical protein